MPPQLALRKSQTSLDEYLLALSRNISTEVYRLNLSKTPEGEYGRFKILSTTAAGIHIDGSFPTSTLRAMK
jgi:hypothetical protein